MMYRSMLAAVLTLAVALPVLSATCPTYTHKDDIKIGQASALPDGWFVYNIVGQNGLYKSSLKSYTKTVVPGTENDRPSSMDISDDGKWIVYSNGGSLTSPTVIIRADGTNRTELKTDTLNYWTGRRGQADNYPEIVGFVRSSPNGAEIYYPIMPDYLWAHKLTLPATGAPTLGTRRQLAFFGQQETVGITWYGGYRFGVWKDEIFGFFTEDVNGTFNRTDFLTIPNNGLGTATTADFAKYLNDGPTTFESSGDYWGCGHTISWDGTLCLCNSGWIGSACVPNKKTIVGGNGMDHKGFYITKFYRSNATQIALDDIIDKPAYGVSINWVPAQYRTGSFSEMDFNKWNFSNHNEYLIGSQSGSATPVKCLWVVNWQTSTWTMVTPNQTAETYDDPAIYITAPSAVSAPAHSSIDPALEKTGGRVVLSASQNNIRLPEAGRAVSLYSAAGRLLWRQARVGHERTIALPARVRGAGAVYATFE